MEYKLRIRALELKVEIVEKIAQNKSLFLEQIRKYRNNITLDALGTFIHEEFEGNGKLYIEIKLDDNYTIAFSNNAIILWMGIKGSYPIELPLLEKKFNKYTTINRISIEHAKLSVDLTYD